MRRIHWPNKIKNFGFIFIFDFFECSSGEIQLKEREKKIQTNNNIKILNSFYYKSN